MAGSLFVGVKPHRAACRPRRVIDRLVDVTGGTCQLEVARQLGEMRLEVGLAEVLERSPDFAVKPPSLRRREILVECLANQRMGEAVALALGRNPGDQAG